MLSEKDDTCDSLVKRKHTRTIVFAEPWIVNDVAAGFTVGHVDVQHFHSDDSPVSETRLREDYDAYLVLLPDAPIADAATYLHRISETCRILEAALDESVSEVEHRMCEVTPSRGLDHRRLYAALADDMLLAESIGYARLHMDDAERSARSE